MAALTRAHRTPPDPSPEWFQRHYGRNRAVLRGTEWERWIRWPWEDDADPGPHCERGRAPTLEAFTLWGLEP